MDQSLGMLFKENDIGLPGERVSFIHNGRAADLAPVMVEVLEEIDGERVIVNRWARQQFRRMAYVLRNPDIAVAVGGGDGIGIVDRKAMIRALRSV